MITKLKIHNFQCHRNLELDLGRSTVLQGGSNHGKTAVLRALYWVLFNKAPKDFVFYGARKKTKNSSKIQFKDDAYTSVIVEIDGHVIERKRSNDFNGYIVDGTVYEALRDAVPEEVTKIFNLADASVQRQFDAPFLLSETPGDASRYLNSLAGLECVDDILSIAKRKVAEASELVETTKDAVDVLANTVSSLGWVEKAEKLYDKAQATQPKIDELTRKLESLTRTIDDYKAIPNYPEIPEWLVTGDRSEKIGTLELDADTLGNYISVCRKLSVYTPALAGLARLVIPVAPEHDGKDIASLEDSIGKYAGAVRSYRKYSSAIRALSELKEPAPCKWEGKLRPLVQSIRNYAEYRDIVDATESVSHRLSKLKEPKPCKWTGRDLSTLVSSIRTYRSATDTIADCKDYLDDAYDSLDGVVCPTCGRPMSRDTCSL